MKHQLVFLLITILLISCDKQNSSNECADAICTEDFRIFNVKVVDTNDKKIVLKSFMTLNIPTADTITFSMNDDTTYTVLDDSYREKIYNQTVDFRFYGTTQNGDEFNQPYSFTADCCHVSKVSGTETIIVYK